ncbi:MAG: lipoyl synthase, partial [Kiritimatiellaceae bacterium]|nr:lipoyl synthase [Kiritimatiellaceae bacterium]
MKTSEMKRKRERLPDWFKTKLPEAGMQTKIFSHTTTSASSLHTVCEEAKCPNKTSCWSKGTATFMVAGQSCTRNCRFCSVEHQHSPPPPDPDEPTRLATAIN